MTRWVLHSDTRFEARHALTLYMGKPEESHTHEWRVAIQVGTDALNEEGYAVDFHAIHRALGNAVRPLDGSNLNEHAEIGSPTPSAERVAEVIAGWLEPVIARLDARLLSVSVWEGPENRVDLNLVPPPSR